MPPCIVEQNTGPDYVRMNEILRIVDAPVHMRLGGEIHHRKELVLGHEGIHLVGICDVGLEEFIAIAVLLRDAFQIGEIAGVSEHVDIRDVGRLVVIEKIADEVAPDESTAARDQNTHGSGYLAASTAGRQWRN